MLDSEEFAEWVAYWHIEPWGEERADLRAGIIAATVANCAPFKKSTRSFHPSEFMPFAKNQAHRQSAKEFEARMMAWATAYKQSLQESSNG